MFFKTKLLNPTLCCTAFVRLSAGQRKFSPCEQFPFCQKDNLDPTIVYELVSSYIRLKFYNESYKSFVYVYAFRCVYAYVHVLCFTLYLHGKIWQSGPEIPKKFH